MDIRSGKLTQKNLLTSLIIRTCFFVFETVENQRCRPHRQRLSVCNMQNPEYCLYMAQKWLKGFWQDSMVQIVDICLQCMFKHIRSWGNSTFYTKYGYAYETTRHGGMISVPVNSNGRVWRQSHRWMLTMQRIDLKHRIGQCPFIMDHILRATTDEEMQAMIRAEYGWN